ncbi:MAG: GNAT family N-acetyltransferase [Clostridiales bacterium]|jgi:GNAT superfamily N-acetyltransferase|nr:GNAT family N-acetyltransferase [Clostridiales bacterium]
MDITIRKVLPEEAYEYAACHIACWQSAYKGIMPDEYLDNMPAKLEERTESCRQALSEPGDYGFFCAVYEGKMIGRLIICKSRDDDKPNAGEIAAIYLLEEFWDKGYGRQMMDYAIEMLITLGYQEFFIWVLEENRRARRFYEKYGFRFDGAKKEIKIDKLLVVIRYVFEAENKYTN